MVGVQWALVAQSAGLVLDTLWPNTVAARSDSNIPPMIPHVFTSTTLFNATAKRLCYSWLLFLLALPAFLAEGVQRFTHLCAFLPLGGLLKPCAQRMKCGISQPGSSCSVCRGNVFVRLPTYSTGHAQLLRWFALFGSRA